jgi:hypothetical protein
MFLARRFFSPWWWGRYDPPKHRFSQEPHGITSQETAFFIVTVVKTSNHTHHQPAGLCSWDISPVRYELGFYIPEDDILHSHRCENLSSYIYFLGWGFRAVRRQTTRSSVHDELSEGCCLTLTERDGAADVATLVMLLFWMSSSAWCSQLRQNSQFWDTSARRKQWHIGECR